MPLFCALSLDVLENTRCFNLNGADFNSRIRTDGWIPSKTVSSNRAREQTGVVQLLLTHGAEVNAQDRLYNTALVLAAKNGHVQTVQTLLEHGAKIDAKSYEGFKALAIASVKGYANIVHSLLNKGASTDYAEGVKALVSASYRGHLEISQMLLTRGVDVDADVDQGPFRLNAKENVHNAALLITSLRWYWRRQYPETALGTWC